MCRDKGEQRSPRGAVCTHSVGWGAAQTPGRVGRKQGQPWVGGEELTFPGAQGGLLRRWPVSRGPGEGGPEHGQQGRAKAGECGKAPQGAGVGMRGAHGQETRGVEGGHPRGRGLSTCTSLPQSLIRSTVRLSPPTPQARAKDTDMCQACPQVEGSDRSGEGSPGWLNWRALSWAAAKRGCSAGL